jgi:peptidoglycan/xylan/chitin deacetylase (PgdA/CDA1 family)
MRCLARAGYTPITLEAWLAYRSNRGTLPRRPVIITFDDGYQDCAEYAVPILKKHGFSAVFYVVAGLMGKTSRWLLSERGIEFPLFDAATARQLEAAGFQCGSHSLSHPRLADLPMARCRHELLRSRQLLEDHLGHEVRHLAYPFGSVSEGVRAIVGETGYLSACSVKSGLSTVNDDPLVLHRVPVNGDDSLLDFLCSVRTGQSLRDFIRTHITWWRRHVHAFRSR